MALTASGSVGAASTADSSTKAAAVAADDSAGDEDAAAAGNVVADISATAVAHSAVAATNLPAAAVTAAGGKHGGDAGDLTAGLPAAAAAGLSQAGATTSGGAATGAVTVPTFQVHASVDSDGFSQGLATQVSWMVGNGVNNAKLQVNPPQLGPIEVSISVQGDQAQVSMTTHSAVAREALQASTPQLRDMLGAQGFGQVNVDISQRSFQDRSSYTPPYERMATSERETAATGITAAGSVTSARTSMGGLDAYA
jgi:flagellar hook-length control protein FliK